jgi:two-component system, chemotaxis family, chemotaxis protein CheY
VQAVEQYKQLQPDLVTMDIVMPDMGGIDAVRAIVKVRSAGAHPDVQRDGPAGLVIEAIQAGARDFVVKPFQPSACWRRCSGCWAEWSWSARRRRASR